MEAADGVVVNRPSDQGTTRTEGTKATVRRVVVVGGVAGGMSAATRLRRLDEHARITVLERSGYVSFANCGLPYHVGQVIPERSSLLLQSPRSLADRFALDVRVRHEVTGIDRDRRVVTVQDLTTGQHFELGYDALILSPGAQPVRPPIAGIERALALRTIEDTDAIIAAAPGARTAMVIGGGFIGVEMAENLTHRGLQVTLVEAAEQVLTALDPEMVSVVHDELRLAGVRLHLGSAVSAVGQRDVTLVSGDVVPADLVIAAIGVKPDTTLAVHAGLRIGPRGGIAVDEQLRTSDPRIFAVGDAVEKVDSLDGEPTLVPLANTANRQGRRVADVIAGRSAADRSVLGTAVVGVFGLTVASTGWSEKRLRAAGRRHIAIHTHPASHATYYPGAQRMSLKLLVDPDTDAILGAQGVGADGVDKRIDVIATAMSAGVPASALADLELAYAPQYSSAKDPVNMLGYIAEGRRTGLSPAVQFHKLPELVDSGAFMLDVRTPGEHADGAIPGSLSIPLDQLRRRLDEVRTDRQVVAYCAVGLRGHTATRLLRQHGINAHNLDGGYQTWLAGTHPAGLTSPDARHTHAH